MYENAQIKKLLAAAQPTAGSSASVAGPKSPLKIIVDTDIGTDIDDSLALLALLNMPSEDYQLLGVTTTYGVTNIRTEVAKAIIDAHFPADKRPPVVCGCGTPIGTHRDVWHTGTEGMNVVEDSALKKLRAEAKTAAPCKDAMKFLVQQAKEHAGLAVENDPNFSKNVKKIVYMGMGNRMNTIEKPVEGYKGHGKEGPIDHGQAYFYFPNHNISGDTLAAMLTFSSGIPIEVINDTVTNKLWFDGDPCMNLMQATEPPSAEVVGKLLLIWLAFRSRIFMKPVRGTCPHDGLTVMAAIYPGDYVQYARGHLKIIEWAGFSVFVPDANGPHQIGVGIDREKALARLKQLLTPAGLKTTYDSAKGSILDDKVLGGELMVRTFVQDEDI